MKRITLVAALAIALLVCIVFAASHTDAFAKGMVPPVALSPGDLKWEPSPDAPGVMVALVWGKMNKGAYGAFVKLPANDMHPLHTHSADVKLVVLAGEFKYTPEGGTEKVLGAGSYLMIPAGSRHTSASGDTECLMFQEQTAAFDLKPVTAK